MSSVRIMPFGPVITAQNVLRQFLDNAITYLPKTFPSDKHPIVECEKGNRVLWPFLLPATMKTLLEKRNEAEYGI
jgi:hypothetical protein